jgi:hypothetical protein
VNRTFLCAIPRRCTMSAQARASARSLFRNFSRAGVAAKRSRTSTFVPGGSPQGASLCFLP